MTSTLIGMTCPANRRPVLWQGVEAEWFHVFLSIASLIYVICRAPRIARFNLHTALQSQKAVTAYLEIKQVYFLPFVLRDPDLRSVIDKRISLLF